MAAGEDLKSRVAEAFKKLDFEKYPVEQIRRELAAMSEKVEIPRGTTVDKVVIAGYLPAEWVKAANVPAENEQTVLYFHGGGFAIGSCATHRNLAALISRAGGVRVLVVEYRLAPEHKFPAANDDCLAAYRWLVGNGVPADKIIIGGDSAGGTLTLMTLITLRDAGDPLPAAAFMLSPPGDLIHFDGESYISRAELDPICSLKNSQIIAGYFIGSPAEKPAILSPIRQNLGGLPSLFIQVGDHEVLLSDSVRLAERAREAGVDVTLEVWDNMWHGFQALAAVLPEAEQAVNNIGRFIKKHLGIQAAGAAQP
ncbi:MAG: alpha/beta hydrolase [Firmicutes bacterium]|nr:alpha/beta hydrolase [Bacillota bacterium]